jgi:hypothetical protein
MQYTIRLADGRELKKLTKNGDNFVSETQVDESIFEYNTETVTITDEEGNETVLRNAEFIQQMEFADGFYICFREKSEMELTVTDLQEALAEVYELIIGGGI